MCACQPQEIAILREIDHPNVVRLLDVYDEEKKLMIVMECLGEKHYRFL